MAGYKNPQTLKKDTVLLSCLVTVMDGAGDLFHAPN